MKHATFIAAAISVISTQAFAQQRINYEISFPNRAQHEGRVAATFTGIPRGSTLHVRMAASSPGRYALTGFAKNVYDVVATDSRGRKLKVVKPDPDGWDVTGHDGVAKVSYKVWGDRADGTFLQIDHSHAHMNIPATFVFARGMDRAPITLRIDVPENWRVATQLVPTANPNVFTAPNMQYFMDSPVEVGPLQFATWSDTTNGKISRIRLAVHHLGTQAQVDAYAAMARKVIAEHMAVFQDPPGFDFGTYTFICDYLPWVGGDGMEHRNSTVITSSRNTLADSAGRRRLLGTLSHEFFHAWNMERIRSRDLEPFDFERANMSRDLWFGEGFTNYYGPLARRRAGFLTDDDFVAGMGGELIGTINSPARQHNSPVEMSMLAPFIDGAAFLDPMNAQEIVLSYYTWGSIVAFGLDLTLRTRYNTTLDDYMRAVWKNVGSKQNRQFAPARPYTTADLRNELAKLTGDHAFAHEFFARYVEGREVQDFTPLLARAGILLKADSTGPYLGASLDKDSNFVFVNWSAANSSAYHAGLSSGDLVYSINGIPVNTPDSMNAIVARYRIGDVLQLEVDQRQQKRLIPMRLIGSPVLSISTYEKAGLPVTAEMLKFREEWLGAKAH
jgi:predicted metalloprotease with PDZ domain